MFDFPETSVDDINQIINSINPDKTVTPNLEIKHSKDAQKVLLISSYKKGNNGQNKNTRNIKKYE